MMKGLTWLLPVLWVAQSLILAETPEPYNSDKTDTRPLAPAEAASQWRWPGGFKVSVFAAEPDVRQPIAMAMDSRGRLWVAECYTYAEARTGFAQDLRDRILIFEDLDGDGKFDKRVVFMEGLQRLSSLELGFGGVWALASPNLLFIPDADGDDRPDGPALVKLEGFDWQRNHHTMANGLRWGPDGWLYGRHGIQATSSLGRPGTPVEGRPKTNGGIWRFHPRRETVEIVCEGTTNPWGMDWNAYGEGFFINTVIGHLWQVIPGAHYRRMHGADLNPHAYEVIEQHADHQHWASGEAWHSWQKTGTTGASSAAGGGHAHTGLMFYNGDNWPGPWRGKMFTINFNGRRLNVDAVTRTDGSGYVGRHTPDIGFAADSWFRGIDLLCGADGGVFIADWSDTGECHDSDGVFRQSGRIYKVTHGQPARPEIADIARLAPSQLPALLDHPNEFFSRHARRRLQELAAVGVNLAEVQIALRDRFSSSRMTVPRLRALWALHAAGGTDISFYRTLLADADEHVRAWAIRLLVDDFEAIAGDANSIRSLARTAASETSPFVRLALASALQRLPLDRRAEVARPLIRRGEDAADPNLPQMIWYGIEPLGNSDPGTLAALGLECELPLTRRCIARRLTLDRSKDESALNRLLEQAAGDVRRQADLLTGMRDALNGERKAAPPSGWKSASSAFAKNRDPRVRDLFRTLGAVFGDPLALESSREVVLDTSEAMQVRRAALRSLIEARADGLRSLCESALPVPGLSATAADGLALESDPGIAEKMLARLATFPGAERTAVLSAILSRPAWAARVVEAIADGRLARSELGAFQLRQIRGFQDVALTRRLNEVWGVSRDSNAEKQARIGQWRSRLSPERLAKADLARGRVHFQTLCAACHVLNGEGGKIGPELTGSARDNLDYLLQNILDPSAMVAREYLLVTFNMKDGRSLGGFVRSRNERFVVLQTLSEAVSLPVSEIADTESSGLSLMPEGLLEALKEEEVRDLLAYLMRR